MKIISLVLICLVSIACNKEKFFDGPNSFQDDFENYSQLDDLLPDNDPLWSFAQLTRPENRITVDSLTAHSGSKSLKFEANKSVNGDSSKSSLVKQNMAFWNGETVRITSWYFIENIESLEWLFLMDIEEQTAIGAGPGMRIALVNNKLRIEHKFLEDDILQTLGEEIPFPRNQWVEIVWEIKLSDQDDGTVKLWQDGQLIIDSQGNTTLPKDLLYFQQGTKGMYSSVEIGITANSQDNNLTIWVDDFEVRKIQ